MDNVSWFRLYTIGLYKKKILLMDNQLGTHPYIWTTLKSLFLGGGGKCNYRKCIEYVKLTHDYSLAIINHVDPASVTTKEITIFQIWDIHL